MICQWRENSPAHNGDVAACRSTSKDLGLGHHLSIHINGHQPEIQEDKEVDFEATPIIPHPLID